MTDIKKINEKLTKDLTVGEYLDLIELMLNTVGRENPIENRNPEGKRRLGRGSK